MSCIRDIENPRSEEIPPEPETFLRWLGGSAWIRVAGRDRSRTRVVSTLLHGNEPSGLRAVHAWLRSGASPATDVILFIGAVAAALEPPSFAHRMLPGRRDLNRCFADAADDEEGRIAEEALQRLRDAQPEALVDIHNTTGRTPPYGVGPSLRQDHLHLAAFFADRYVHNDLKLGALVETTDPLFPSVVVECGTSGDPAADAVARSGLEKFLEAETLACHGRHGPVEVLHAPVRICLSPGTRVRYGHELAADVDLTVESALDRHNFQPLAPGQIIGWTRAQSPWPFEARGADGVDVSRELFTVRDGRVETQCEIVPVMTTTNPDVALEDCLFYAVRRLQSQESGAASSIAS